MGGIGWCVDLRGEWADWKQWKPIEGGRADRRGWAWRRTCRWWGDWQRRLRGRAGRRGGAGWGVGLRGGGGLGIVFWGGGRGDAGAGVQIGVFLGAGGAV